MSNILDKLLLNRTEKKFHEHPFYGWSENNLKWIKGVTGRPLSDIEEELECWDDILEKRLLLKNEKDRLYLFEAIAKKEALWNLIMLHHRIAVLEEQIGKLNKVYSDPEKDRIKEMTECIEGLQIELDRKTSELETLQEKIRGV